MALRVVGAGLGRTGTAFAPGRAPAAARRPAATTWARRSAAPTTSRCGTRRCNGESARLVGVPRRLRRHRRLAGVRVLARARGGEPRRHRAPVEPVECGRVVDERQRHDLPGLDPGSPGRARRRVGRAARDGEGHVREDVHPRMVGRVRGEARLRGAQRRRCAPRSIRLGWSTGNRATGGSRSARRCRSPCRTTRSRT